MTRIAQWICLWLIIFFAKDVAGQLRFNINGRINNSADTKTKNSISNGDFIILNFLNLPRKDTVKVQNSTFHIEGEVPYPSIAMIEYKYGGDLILLDNSTYQYALELKIVDSTNRVYESNISTQSPFFNAWSTFYDGKRELLMKKEKLTAAANLCKDTDSSLYYKSAIEETNQEIIATYHQLAVDHPNSYIAAYIIPAAPDFNYNNYISIYNTFSDSIRNSFYGKNFYSRMIASKESKANEQSISKNREAGMFPATAAVDTSLKKVMLDKTFFHKQQYTLVEFWASWCGPCRKVNERLKEMTPLLKKKDVTVVNFSLDLASEAWRIAVINDKMPWLQVSDLKATNSPLSEFLQLTVIPANVLVDRTGKIVRTNIYDKELDDFLKSVN